MVVAVKQIVRIEKGGLVRLRSKELKAGDEAEVIVLVTDRASLGNGKTSKATRRTTKAKSGVRTAKMTKQLRGDIAQASRVRQAIQAGREKLIPWEQVKRELGLK